MPFMVLLVGVFVEIEGAGARKVVGALVVLGASFSLMFFVGLTSCVVGIVFPNAHYLAVPDDNVFFSIFTSGFEFVS